MRPAPRVHTHPRTRAPTSATHLPWPGHPGVTDTKGTPGERALGRGGSDVPGICRSVGSVPYRDRSEQQWEEERDASSKLIYLTVVIWGSRNLCISHKVGSEGSFFREFLSSSEFAPFFSLVQRASFPAPQIIHKGIFISVSFGFAACPGLLHCKPQNVPFYAHLQWESLPNRIKP